jgi:hypothetical protein
VNSNEIFRIIENYLNACAVNTDKSIMDRAHHEYVLALARCGYIDEAVNSSSLESTMEGLSEVCARSGLIDDAIKIFPHRPLPFFIAKAMWDADDIEGAVKIIQQTKMDYFSLDSLDTSRSWLCEKLVETVEYSRALEILEILYPTNKEKLNSKIEWLNWKYAGALVRKGLLDEARQHVKTFADSCTSLFIDDYLIALLQSVPIEDVIAEVSLYKNNELYFNSIRDIVLHVADVNKEYETAFRYITDHLPSPKYNAEKRDGIRSIIISYIIKEKGYSEAGKYISRLESKSLRDLYSLYEKVIKGEITDGKDLLSSEFRNEYVAGKTIMDYFIDEQFRNKNFDAVAAIIPLIRNAYESTKLIQRIAVEKAKFEHEDALEYAKKIKETFDRQTTVALIAQEVMKKGDLATGLQILKKIKDNEVCSWHQYLWVEHYLVMNDYETAVEVCKTISFEKCRFQSYMLAILYLFDRGKESEAISLCDVLDDSTMGRNSRFFAYIYLACFSAWREKREMKALIEILIDVWDGFKSYYKDDMIDVWKAFNPNYKDEQRLAALFPEKI